MQAHMSPALAEGVKFTRAFAPQAGLVSQYEESARQEICLNGSWQFQGTADTSVPNAESIWSRPMGACRDQDSLALERKFILDGFGRAGRRFRAYPSYPKEWENVKAAWMQKTVMIPKDWERSGLSSISELLPGKWWFM